VRRKLLQATDLHTILRLPTGIFYAQGVKANVLIFDNKKASKETQTKQIWIYDYRTNVHHTLKKKPMSERHLRDFVTRYCPGERQAREETWSEEHPEGRWRCYDVAEVLSRDKASPNIFWLKDQSVNVLENLPEPDILSAEIIAEMETGLLNFRSVLQALEKP